MIYLHIACTSLILFTIALLIGKQKKLPDYILIAWLTIFLSNLATFIYIGGFPYNFGFWGNLLVQISDSSVFLHGPAFWFFTLSVSKRNFRFAQRDVWHLMPFIVVAILRCSGAISYNADMQGGLRALVVVKFASLLFYTVKSFLFLQNHRQGIKDIFSNSKNKTLNWLRFLSLGIFVLWSVGLYTTILSWTSSYSNLAFDNHFFQISIDLFIIVMSYFGFQQESLYSITGDDAFDPGEIQVLHPVSDENSVITELFSEKYQKSGLSATRAQEIHRQLLKTMEQDRAFLDENLTLFKLAKMLNTTPNYLSQVINNIEHRNFFDYINSFRIEAVKQRINSKACEHLTLAAIAFDCGFNSKTSFNRAFKKFTGQTPTKYKIENRSTG